MFIMNKYSTRQAAQKLGIGHSTLAHLVDQGKVPAPAHVPTGSKIVHIWTDEDIERVRALLPKIANGRKTRHQRKRSLKLKEDKKPKKK